MISRGVAGHGLVDRVVDHFVDQVVQPADGRVGDVHAGPFADVLQVAEVLELVGPVFGLDLPVLGKIIVLCRRTSLAWGRLRWDGSRLSGSRLDLGSFDMFVAFGLR